MFSQYRYVMLSLGRRTLKYGIRTSELIYMRALALIITRVEYYHNSNGHLMGLEKEKNYILKELQKQLAEKYPWDWLIKTAEYQTG